MRFFAEQNDGPAPAVLTQSQRYFAAGLPRTDDTNHVTFRLHERRQVILYSSAASATHNPSNAGCRWI